MDETRFLKEVEDYKPSNREEAMQPKSGKFWCGCDRFLVGPGQKCPVCGDRVGQNIKKWTNA
jgi:hypothetical protein